jgi:phage terminase large subunit-like protein
MARDYVDRATDYCKGVAAGLIPACKLTIGACRRQLDDLERSAAGDADFPYVFDRASGNRICAWIEMFPHVKGAWARSRNAIDRLIRIEDWQCFIGTTAFGWLHRDTGHRRFRAVYIEVPRKNAKTTLSAPIALYMLTADGEPGAEIVAAATKKDQASIVFGIAQSMVRKTADFRTEFGVQARAHSILCLETDATFKAIDSRGSTQDGANLHFSLNDELHAWKGRDLYAVLETAMGSREQPMMWNITTAGSDSSGICYEQRGYLVKVLTRVQDDETLFGVIYSIDEGDDIYAEATWRKANPNYGVSVLPADMTAQAHKAKQNPKSRADFRMKRLNQWISAASAYFDLDEWDRGARPELRDTDFADAECIVGLDLASKRDINAAIRWFERDGTVTLFCDFWLPQAAIDSGVNAAYKGWVEEGWLRVTPGNVVDYDAIRDRIADDYARLHVLKEVAFDPHQAQHMINNMMADGIPCVEMRPLVLTFSPAMKQLDALIADGRLTHDGNPVMRWMMGNVVAVTDHKDNVYPRKEQPEAKIDGPVAAIMASARTVVVSEPSPVPQLFVI